MNFILGKLNNAATAITGLSSNIAGPALRVVNPSAAATATALTLQTRADRPPMMVNSATKVDNLNADKVDGKHADQLVRVASFTGQSPLADGTNGTLATTTITTPAPGFLALDVGSDVTNLFTSDYVTCYIEVDDAGIARGSERYIRVDWAANVNEEEDCSTNTVVPVAAVTHTVDLEVRGVDQPKNAWSDTALSAIYIPFDGAGASPSSATISAAQEKAQAPESRK